MRRALATGLIIAATAAALLGGAATATATPRDDDEPEINQEKVAELNLLCNVAILAVQKDAECGGSQAADDDETIGVNAGNNLNFFSR